VLFFTTLAHGAVEPWSIAVAELMLVLLLLLWGIKATLDGKLELTIPPAALPIIALLAVGIAQSVAFTGSDGRRVSLSLDIEATRHAVTLLFFLLFAFIAAANFLVTRDRLLQLANVITIFGALLAAFGLIQYFAWDGRFYWVRPTASVTVFGPFVNRNHFAGYMAMAVPIPVGLMLHSHRGQARMLYGFAAALMGISVLVSNSRSGALSLIASMAVLMVVSWTSRRRSDASRIVPIALVTLAMVAGAVRP